MAFLTLVGFVRFQLRVEGILHSTGRKTDENDGGPV